MNSFYYFIDDENESLIKTSVRVDNIYEAVSNVADRQRVGIEYFVREYAHLEVYRKTINGYDEPIMLYVGTVGEETRGWI